MLNGHTGGMPFYRRRWNESRGDVYDGWGGATYYIWVHQGVLEQQLELCDSGVLLAYDRYYLEDQYGFMTAERLDPDEWAAYEISIEDYQRETDVPPFNRRG